MPYFSGKSPEQIVLVGELDFDITKTPRLIYDRLRRIAEDVGGMVESSGLHHGGRITVYPAYGNDYYVLNLHEAEIGNAETLQVTSVKTWRQVELIDLVERRKRLRISSVTLKLQP